MNRIKKHLNANPIIHLLIGASLLLFLLLYPKIGFRKADADSFNSKLNSKEKLAQGVINELITKKKAVLFHSSHKYDKLFTNEGIAFFVFQDNKQTFWTSRSIAFSNELTEFPEGNGLVKLKNGWYQYIKKQYGKRKYLALILIKTDYEIQNAYLPAKFHESFGLSEQLTINEKISGQDKVIYNVDGDPLFSLIQEETPNNIDNTNWLMIILFLLGYFQLICFVSKQSLRTVSLRKMAPALVILFVIASRLLLLYQNHYFSIVYQQNLFSPTIYAQSDFLPSLGDLFITAILFSVVVFYLVRVFDNIQSYRRVSSLFFITLSGISNLFVVSCLEGLVKNSSINFDVSSLFDLSVFSIIGIVSILLLFIFQIVMVYAILHKFSDKAFKRIHLTRIYWSITTLIILIGYYFFSTNLVLSSGMLALIIVFSFYLHSKPNFYWSILFSFIISLTISYGFIFFEQEKEIIAKEFIAKNLAKERDPITEYLFGEIKQKIEQDTLIKNNIVSYWGNQEKVNQHIIDKYFGGFWHKYEVTINACNENDSIALDQKSSPLNCLTYYQNKIETLSNQTNGSSRNIHFIQYEDGSGAYLSKITLAPSNTSNYHYLFIELTPRIFAKSEGYPELLLNEKEIGKPVDLQKYAFAKYKNNQLINSSGNFNYNAILLNSYKFDDRGFFNTNFDSFNHTIYRSDKFTTIVLSSPQKVIFDYLTTLSYFFIINSLIILIIGFLLKSDPFHWKIAFTDFSTKIQLFIVVSILLSFALFGWGTSYYIKKQYVSKNKKNVNEKVQSILIELEHKLGTEKSLSPILYDYMTYYLVKFSNVFYTDINLYDKQGILLASSRPEIFERGLISKKMDFKAFKQLHYDQKSAFIHDENIGTLNYLSAYVPFRNEQNEVLAYLNLPYFSKQDELENELSSFFTTLIDVYALTSLIAVLIAIFFVNYISAPLRMIKDKIGGLNLDKSYELIDWESDDEIGALVVEYNEKVKELRSSVSKLAKSERESAWREMAKQVAHEIKNPLTPMKLSIQHLQRISTENSEDIKDRLERTAKTLIEQIDTLSNIATEFSNFAKMPKAKEQVIQMVPIIETVIDLYKKEMNLTFINDCSEELSINADKDEVSRMLSNIIKNAIQAIPDAKKGEIVIHLSSSTAEKLLVKITDNGIGIDESEKEKIFTPNFTTKTSGMGLGLAMVKNMIQNANGKIWFESKKNEGTTFFIEFPTV